MLLIDGVKYELWMPRREEEEFEPLVLEHSHEIFGNNSIYVNVKRKMRSKAGIASIPDGYVIDFDKQSWHIVEIEISSHPLYEHIVTQITKFNNGIKNHATQKDIVSLLYEEITSDKLTELRVRKYIQHDDLFKYLSDLITQPPFITVIIEQITEDLKEALNSLPLKNGVVEFKTYVRSDINSPLVHAHIFDPVFKEIKIKAVPKPEPNKISIAKRVSFQELLNAGLVKDGQLVHFHNTRPFNEEKARIIVAENKLQYILDNKLYSTTDLATRLLIKHGFKHDEHTVAGPRYWRTEADIAISELNNRIRKNRGY